MRMLRARLDGTQVGLFVVAFWLGGWQLALVAIAVTWLWGWTLFVIVDTLHKRRLKLLEEEGS